MGCGVGGALSGAGTAHGCKVVRERSVEEVEVGTGGGLGGVISGGGTQCAPPAQNKVTLE